MTAEKPCGAFFHLFLTSDGEVGANELFLTATARAEWLIEQLEQGSFGDSDEFRSLIEEQDQEAMAADYPEGVSPSLPSPVDRMDGIRDFLSNEGYDLFLDELTPMAFACNDCDFTAATDRQAADHAHECRHCVGDDQHTEVYCRRGDH